MMLELVDPLIKFLSLRKTFYFAYFIMCLFTNGKVLINFQNTHVPFSVFHICLLSDTTLHCTFRTSVVLALLCIMYEPWQ